MKPLSIIFKNCLQTGTFPNNWKRPNVVPIHKRGDKQLFPVACTPYQKHLGLYLDEKINFNHHINVKISKANKGTGIIKRLSHILPRKSLITIYKSLIRPPS